MKYCEETDELTPHTTNNGITPGQQILASCSGALITSVFVTPLDVVKVRLQKQVSLKSKTNSPSYKETIRNWNSYFKSRLLTPLDVVKVRLQMQAQPVTTGRCFMYSNGLMDHLCTCVSVNPRNQIHSTACEWYARPGHFNGTIDAFVKIARSEGIASLWSGLSPTLVMAVPATVCYFTMYDNLNSKLQKSIGSKFWVPMLSGSLARTAVVTLVSPLELVRTKFQSEELSYFELGKAIKLAKDQKGWLSLWQGWVPTIWRDVPFSALYWCNYELLKRYLIQSYGFTQTTFEISFIAGFLSGSFAAMVTLPFDVIKTHRQIEIGELQAKHDHVTKPSSTWKLIQQLYGRQGIQGLFAGAVPRLVKIAPACAIMIGTYEYGKIFFAKRNRQT